MDIYTNKLWISDLDKTIAALPLLEELTGEEVLVTGCTGLICSAVVDLFIRWNETHKKVIKIIAAGRDINKIKKRFHPYSDKEYFKVVRFDATISDFAFDFTCDYIINGAGNAFPGKIIQEPVETMLSTFIGLRNLLVYAQKSKVKRVLHISSSEVYGKKVNDEPSKINDHGWIDILNPRSSYSIGKCAAETLCASFADEYGVDSVIVRPGHIYGPTANESDNRVSSAWAYAAARGKDMVMKSDGSQIRSYCYCLDSASAILTVLLKGQSIHAYNISNPDSIISIKDMACILSRTAGVTLKIELPTEDERKGFNPMKNSSLDSKELLELGWIGLFDAETGFSHTVRILNDNIE